MLPAENATGHGKLRNRCCPEEDQPGNRGETRRPPPVFVVGGSRPNARFQVPGTPWHLRGCRPCLQRDGLRVMAPPELVGEVEEAFALKLAAHHEQGALLGSP